MHTQIIKINKLITFSLIALVILFSSASLYAQSSKLSKHIKTIKSKSFVTWYQADLFCKKNKLRMPSLEELMIIKPDSGIYWSDTLLHGKEYNTIVSLHVSEIKSNFLFLNKKKKAKILCIKKGNRKGDKIYFPSLNNSTFLNKENDNIIQIPKHIVTYLDSPIIKYFKKKKYYLYKIKFNEDISYSQLLTIKDKILIENKKVLGVVENIIYISDNVYTIVTSEEDKLSLYDFK
jgi:hypothetical protein